MSSIKSASLWKRETPPNWTPVSVVWRCPPFGQQQRQEWSGFLDLPCQAPTAFWRQLHCSARILHHAAGAWRKKDDDELITCTCIPQSLHAIVAYSVRSAEQSALEPAANGHFLVCKSLMYTCIYISQSLHATIAC